MKKIVFILALTIAFWGSTSLISAKSPDKISENPSYGQETHLHSQRPIDVLITTASIKGLKGPVKEVHETDEIFWMASSITQHPREKGYAIYDKTGLLTYEEVNNDGAMYGTTYSNGLPSKLTILNTTLDKTVFESIYNASRNANTITLQEIHDNVPMRKQEYKLENGRITEHIVFNLNNEPYQTTTVTYDMANSSVQIKTEKSDDLDNKFFKTETYSVDGSYRILDSTNTLKYRIGGELSEQKAFYYDTDYNLIKIVSTIENKERVVEFSYSDIDKYGNWTSGTCSAYINGSFLLASPIKRVITYHE